MTTSISEIEKRNEIIGWIVSIGFHGLLVLFCFFALAWKRQIPAPPEYGIEVNFGTDDQGFGDIQNFSDPGNDPAPNETQTTPVVQEETQAQVQEESEPEKLITGEEETVEIAPKPSPKKVEVEPAPTPVKNPSTTKSTPSAQSLFPSEKSGNTSNNNGNKPGTVGDMGKINGNPDARGIYDGNPGKGKGGSSLDMAGWKWDSKPVVNDESTEEGKVKFQIKVDDEGNIISVTVLEKNISPALVKKYQKEVESLTFSKNGGSNGEGATGTITFLITSK
jgi:outer membrane biosynthesis protein TonB